MDLFGAVLLNSSSKEYGQRGEVKINICAAVDRKFLAVHPCMVYMLPRPPGSNHFGCICSMGYHGV